NQQVVGLRAGHRTHFGHSLRKRLFQALDVVNQLSFLALSEQRTIVVTVFARELADLGNTHRYYWLLGVELERLQLLSGKRRAEGRKRGQTQVRLVNAVLADGLVIGDARKGRLQVLPGRLERGFEKAFHDFKYAIGLGKGHLQIDLRELRLAVGTEIFVAEAAHDLEILVEAGDHQDLLEQLRRLRQRVKLAGINSAGDQVVASAFRSGARHERRFDLKEPLRRQ